jgi:hypothetical protein
MKVRVERRQDFPVPRKMGGRQGLLLLGTFLFLALPFQAVAQPLFRILCDESRAMPFDLPSWYGLLPSDGYVFTISQEPVQFDSLSKYDVLIIANDTERIPYSAQELTAIRRFVGQGGGLLLVGQSGPVAQRIQDQGQYVGNRWENLRPLSPGIFSTNQIGNEFGVFFSNTEVDEIPLFDSENRLNRFINLPALSFEQPLSLLLFDSQLKTEGHLKVDALVQLPRAIVTGAFFYGEGRVIVCGARELFLPFEPAGEEEAALASSVEKSQKQLLERWFGWLARRDQTPSPPERAAQSVPPVILPPIRFKTETSRFRCIEALCETTSKTASDWQRIWPVFSTYLGVASPLEFAPAGRFGRTLEVRVRGAENGAFVDDGFVTLAGLAEDDQRAEVLSCAVGSLLLGGGNSAVAQGFSDWMGLVGLRAAGYNDAAARRLERLHATWRRLDFKGNALNVANPELVASDEETCSAKWTCLLVELERERGAAFFARYLAALRQGTVLADANTKVVGPRRLPITFEDIVRAMGQAAGEDLRPWFKQYGVFSLQEWTFAGEKQPELPEPVLTDPALPPLSGAGTENPTPPTGNQPDWSKAWKSDQNREPWSRYQSASPLRSPPRTISTPLPENRPLDPRKGVNVIPSPRRQPRATGTREPVGRIPLPSEKPTSGTVTVSPTPTAKISKASEALLKKQEEPEERPRRKLMLSE